MRTTISGNSLFWNNCKYIRRILFSMKIYGSNINYFIHNTNIFIFIKILEQTTVCKKQHKIFNIPCLISVFSSNFTSWLFGVTMNIAAL
jgi:uncharacterized protein (DUF927 family)